LWKIFINGQGIKTVLNIIEDKNKVKRKICCRGFGRVTDELDDISNCCQRRKLQTLLREF
jgi:hypothetical protein